VPHFFVLLVGILVKNYGCPHDGSDDHDLTAASGLVFGLLRPFWVSDVGYGSGNGGLVPPFLTRRSICVLASAVRPPPPT